MSTGSLSLRIKNGPMTVCDVNGLTTEQARETALRHLGISKAAVTDEAMVDKLAEIASLLIVTEAIESGGYDWPRIDKLLFDEGVAAWLKARVSASSAQKDPSA